MSVSPKPDSRPLSPHLQVWRWHVTMLSSILHRATGVALYVGTLALAKWLIALVFFPDWFPVINDLLLSPLGQLALYGMAASLCYHLANGVRHLIWDLGHGLAPGAASASAWMAIGFGLLAPIGLWALAAAKGG